jgi:hypothetical protein
MWYSIDERRDRAQAKLVEPVDVGRDLVGQAELALRGVVLPPFPLGAKPVWTTGPGTTGTASAVHGAAALSRGGRRRGWRLHLRRLSGLLLEGGHRAGADRKSRTAQAGRQGDDTELNALSASHV